MNQVNVDNAMNEAISLLGLDVAIFAENGEICLSVVEEDAKKLERVLYRNDIDFIKERDGWVVNYIFAGEYDDGMED